MKHPCHICGQHMDFCVTSFNHQPFIDGKRYKRICFTCAQVPQDYVQTYLNDNIVEQQGPFFDWKHLCTPEELVKMGAAETLEEANRSVKAVRRKLRDIGAQVLNKLKLTRPKNSFDILDKE